MRPKINLFRRELTQFGDKLFAMLHVGVVRFIRAEEAPNRFEFTAIRFRVHANRYWE